MKITLTIIPVMCIIMILGGCQQGTETRTISTGSTQPGNTSLTQTSTETQSTVTTTKTTVTTSTSSTQLPPVGINIGNRAPEFKLKTLNGRNVSLNEFKGKPVLLNFWATWCPPCQSEMPFLQKIQDTYSAKGLVLLAVDAGEKDGAVQSFMTNHNLSMTIPMDYDISVARQYNITTIPRTFFIDKEGIIRAVQPGAFLSVQDIEERLAKIME